MTTRISMWVLAGLMVKRNNKTKIALVVFVLVVSGLLGLKSCLTLNSTPTPLVDLLVEYRAELEAPGLNIRTAAANLETADAAFAFVRDHTAYSAYFGRRQTADNMLRTRTGNSPDRAFLLAELLSEMGWTTKLYQTDNPQDKPQSGDFHRKPSKVLKKIAKRIDYDLKQQDDHVAKLKQAVDVELDKINKKVDKTLAILQAKTNYTYAGQASSNPNFRRVYVVATKEGEKERYFDPTYPDHDRPETDTEFWNEYPAHPTGVELWMTDSRGVEQQLLSWQGQTAGHDMHVNFFPTHDPAKVLNGPPDPNRINVWTPVLQIEGETVTGRPFSTGGWAPGIGMEPPSPDILDLAPINPQMVTAIDIHSIDTGNFPQIDVQISLNGQGTGVLLPQHLTITDNGKPVLSRTNKLTPASGAVSIVTDVSGSMDDTEAFAVSKQAIILLSKKLSPDIPVGLIGFAMNPKVEIPLGPLGDGERIRQAAQGLKTRGDTGIYRALNKAAQDSSLANGTIILLTDGGDTVGGSLEETLGLLRAKNIRVIAIALGINADSRLTEQIAHGTGGIALKITNVSSLDEVYALIGRQLSGYTTISYTARGSCFDNLLCKQPIQPATAVDETAIALEPDGNTETQEALVLADIAPTDGVEAPPTDTMSLPPDGPDPVLNVRNLVIGLNGTDLIAEQLYEEPQSPRITRPKLYLVVNTGSYSGWSRYGYPYWLGRETRRNLFYLDDPNIGWNLTGRIDLMLDHGSFAPSVATAAYISNWIDVLRSQELENSGQNSDLFSQEKFERPSYDLISTINGFRALTNAGVESEALLSGGPNIYLKRSLYIAKSAGYYETGIFDVMDRWTRGYGYGASTVEDILRLEIAGSLSETSVLGGQNAIDALLSNPDTIIVTPWNKNPPVKMPDIDPYYLKKFSSSTAPNWVWVVDSSDARNFKGVYIGNGMLAKGSHIEALANEFDKIDKMYELYTNMSGFAGLNAVQGSLLAQIASFKREENKLWCFSTLMLGYVSDAIGDDEALLNQSPQEAKANSARLCKMEFEPEDFGRQVMRNAAKNVADEAKSWAKGKGKSAVKNATTPLGAGTAVAVYDAANTVSGYYNNVVNPTFHMAMAKASGIAE